MKNAIALIMMLMFFSGCEKNNKPNLELINSLMTNSIIHVQITANESILIRDLSANDTTECDVGYETMEDYENGIFLEQGEKYLFSISDCPISNISKITLATDKGDIQYSLSPPEEEYSLDLILPKPEHTTILFMAEPLDGATIITNVNVSGGGCEISESIKETLRKDNLDDSGEPYYLHFDNCSLRDIERIVLTTEKRSYKWIK